VKYKIAIYVFIAVVSAMVSGCATTTRQQPVSGKEEVYLKDVCDQNNVLWEWDQVSQVVTLKYREARAQAMVESDLVLIGGERITLSAPMRRARGAVIVPNDFQGKVIDRLRQKAAPQKGYGIAKVRKVLIDAGHGGKDPGAISRTGIKEKGINLDIAKRLKEILRGKGLNVEMTRDSDVFIPLEGRTAIASRSNADLFVSIHANSSPARSVSGMEVYSERNLKFADRIAAERKINEKLLFKNFAMKRDVTNVQKIVSDMLYTNKQSESRSLARHMAKKASRLAKTKSRGAKTADFHILRNTLIPAILIEVGFLTNPKEERLLNTADYRQKIAQSVAEGVMDYVNEKQ
jgi:N-acetylmuramoyl-L-alanine amidase